MEERELIMKELLSINELEHIVGGISDEEYSVIKVELDQAANRDDFDTFTSIVCKNAPHGGKAFVHKVVDHYTATDFLSGPRYASFLATVLISI